MALTQKLFFGIRLLIAIFALGCVGIAILSFFDYGISSRENVVARADTPRKQSIPQQQPLRAFTYEHRFTAEWKGETQEGTGRIRCEVYSSNAPDWAVRLGSGSGGGDRYSCQGIDVAITQFSDGTQLGCSYRSVKPRSFDSPEGNAQRVWFDAQTRNIPPRLIDPGTGGLQWQGLVFDCFISTKSRTLISYQRVTIPDYTIVPDAPVVHRISTFQISDDRPASITPEKFSSSLRWGAIQAELKDRKKRANGPE